MGGREAPGVQGVTSRGSWLGTDSARADPAGGMLMPSWPLLCKSITVFFFLIVYFKEVTLYWPDFGDPENLTLVQSCPEHVSSEGPPCCL